MLPAAGWLLGLAWAVEPILGPAGWRALGPTSAAFDTDADPVDAVRFDPRTCGVEVARVDLDGGPGARDVRLARVYTGGGWRWADDWAVKDGRLERPGRLPVRLGAGLRVGPETLTLDAAGRVIERRIGGRRLRVLRDESGRFVGMAEGAVEVRWAATGAGSARGRSSDGRVVEYRYERDRLASVTTFEGAVTRYTYGAGGALAQVDDGGTVTIAQEGTGEERATTVDGDRGAWSCRTAEGRTRVTDPTGSVWGWDLDGVEERLTDPVGASVRIRRRDGWLAGWTDARGNVVDLPRDEDGRVTAVRASGLGGWGLGWGDGGLVAVTTPDGASWTVARDRSGARASETDPAGHALTLAVNAVGRLVALSRGAGRWAWRLGSDGRVIEVDDPVAGEVKLARDAMGRVEQVTDGAGGVWRLSYAGDVSVVDPVGGRWVVGRDERGRVVSVVDPTGRRSVVTWERSGALGRLDRDGATWRVYRDAAGALTAVDGPEQGRWSCLRDAAGRVDRLYRPDGGDLDLRRDAAGEIAGIGPVDVVRDGAGRPLSVNSAGRALRAWERDLLGRLVGVQAPGVALSWDRGADGRIGSLRIGAAPGISLGWDSGGRLVRAAGASGITALRRDPAGRVTGIARDTGGGEGSGGRIDVARDRRGLVSRVRVDGEDAWTLHRDPVGRVLVVDGPQGLRLGVDRDAAGRPGLVRFPDGEIVQLAWTSTRLDAQVLDPGGRVLAALGWGWDAVSRLARVSANGEWVLHRDPVGTLVAVESEDGLAWSASPGRLEAPDGTWSALSAGGSRVTGGTGAETVGAGGSWAGSAGERWSYDEAGRLVGGEVSGRAGVTAFDVGWDELGRPVRWGGRRVAGWEGWWAVGGGPAVVVPGVAAFVGGEAVLFGPSGSPAWSSARGALAPAPTGGEAGGFGAGGRVVPWTGGPALDRAGGVDPKTGGPIASDDRWPWAVSPWEVGPGPDLWPDPDGSTAARWDDAPFAATSALVDPLGVLVALGDLPSPGRELGTLLDPGALHGEESRAVGAGLAWLPSTVRPSSPAPLLDPDLLVVDEDPLVRWLLAHATAPAAPPRPEGLAAFVWGPALEPELPVLPRGLEDGGDALRSSLGL